MTTIPDHAERQQALNPADSFIVQAPAGSGKTELLTQRFLVLLAHVERPESILALTFTRKAAAEMRTRILSALERAKTEPCPQASHAANTWRLAQAVLARDETQQWHLLNNPNQLRIQTIDAFCAQLTQQLPLLSGIGANLAVTDNPKQCYALAARRVLQTLGEANTWQAALQHTLLHLDNNYGQFERLAIDLLAKRDQWLGFILASQKQHNLRERLEQGLQAVMDEALQQVAQHFPLALAEELMALARFAAHELDADAKQTAISACFDCKDLPDFSWQHAQQWLGLAELLLTKTKTVRKQVTKTIGFSAASSFKDPEQKHFYQTQKQRMLRLLESITAVPELVAALGDLMDCPAVRYNEQQWQAVSALVELLPVLASQLQLVFRELGCVDFNEISNRALSALGDVTDPSDLALRLDHKISHLLIDEFQDTSITQFQLLETLTAGWQPDDGRSLFLVGDPMQSIYRFRNAEVGLFLKARDFGVGDIQLTALTLSANFRSSATVVDWVNQTFSNVFPKSSTISSGAISYSQSHAMHEPHHNSEVKLHAHLDRQQEAYTITQVIQQLLQDYPNENIAVLVKARSHLLELLPSLQQANITYQAVELDPLVSKPVIQDLWSLTRAILHPADKLAWFSVLRAPWCGLLLSDLLALANCAQTITLWQAITEAEKNQKLSADGIKRLQHCQQALAAAMTSRSRGKLRPRIETAWFKLGGPAVTLDQQALTDALTYFDCLQQYEQASELHDLQQFQQQLSRLFSNGAAGANHQVQIMTIHKSKGLEFDTVILPGLERPAANDTAPLLSWCERTRDDGQYDLLLAPIKHATQKTDPVYQYLRQLEQTKQRHETSRLLYVATTRAKQRLHLSACLELDAASELVPPKSNSLLAPMFTSLKQEFLQCYEAGLVAPRPEPARFIQFQRLRSDWRLPDPINIISYDDKRENPMPENGLIWTSQYKRLLGIFLHRLLQQICLDGYTSWQHNDFSNKIPHWRQRLLELGMSHLELDPACQTIVECLENVLACPRGQWILDNQHQDSRCEYALTGVLDGKSQLIVLDRSFIDKNDNRWIIDYKTATTAAEQAQYQQQLQHYAKILQLQETRPICLGIYYPLTQAWQAF